MVESVNESSEAQEKDVLFITEEGVVNNAESFITTTLEGIKDVEIVYEEVKVKQPIFSKEFPRGFFPGDSALSQRTLAQEAGSHLLGIGKWRVSSETKEDGTIVQSIFEN